MPTYLLPLFPLRTYNITTARFRIWAAVVILSDGNLLQDIWVCMLEMAIRLRECKENIHFASIIIRVRGNLVFGSKGGNMTGKGDNSEDALYRFLSFTLNYECTKGSVVPHDFPFSYKKGSLFISTL